MTSCALASGDGALYVPARARKRRRANADIHLENEVDVERVVEIRRTSAAAVLSFADAGEHALPGLGRTERIFCRLPVGVPPCGETPTRRRGLIDAFATEPEVSPDWNLDFASAPASLLTAACAGLLICDVDPR